MLTAKKGLVTNDLAPLNDYGSTKLGTIAAGFVSKVNDGRLTVTFYGCVHGRVSSRSLAGELGVEDPRVNYNVGDVVLARVVDCVRRRDRQDGSRYHQIKLSLKTVVEEPEKKRDESVTEAEAKAAVPLAAGLLLMPKRMKVLQLVNASIVTMVHSCPDTPSYQSNPSSSWVPRVTPWSSSCRTSSSLTHSAT